MSKEQEFVSLLNNEMDSLVDDYAKRRITDLEAKLAESEQRCQECKHLNKKIELNIKHKFMNEIQQLKQQLAEKESQLTFVKEELAKEEKGHLKQMMDFEKRCQEFYGSNERVIDVLDEVRSLADRLLENFMLSKEYQDRKFRGRKLIEYYPFVNAIDKLIKSLKGKK